LLGRFLHGSELGSGGDFVAVSVIVDLRSALLGCLGCVARGCTTVGGDVLPLQLEEVVLDGAQRSALQFDGVPVDFGIAIRVQHAYEETLLWLVRKVLSGELRS